jgi:hypothetical protein
MESLESKLDRLSPEQRKEIEDFVDFLLSRSGQVYCSPNTTRDHLPVLNMAPPPLCVIEPLSPEEIRPVVLQDTTCTSDRTNVATGINDTIPESFHEIGGGVHDRIAPDYMDYGQFDKQPSPATEAVNKIKRKIISKEAQQKPHHLLEWVD